MKDLVELTGGLTTQEVSKLFTVYLTANPPPPPPQKKMEKGKEKKKYQTKKPKNLTDKHKRKIFLIILL